MGFYRSVTVHNFAQKSNLENKNLEKNSPVQTKVLPVLATLLSTYLASQRMASSVVRVADPWPLESAAKKTLPGRRSAASGYAN